MYCYLFESEGLAVEYPDAATLLVADVDAVPVDGEELAGVLRVALGYLRSPQAELALAPVLLESLPDDSRIKKYNKALVHE